MKIFLCILKLVVLFNSVAAFWFHHGKPPWTTDYEDEYFFNEYEEIQAYEIAEIEELNKKIKSPEIDEKLEKYEKVYADDLTSLLRTLATYKRKLQFLGFYPIVSDSGLRYFQRNSESFEIADEYDEQIYEHLNRPKKPKRFKNGYRPSKKTKIVKDRQTLTTRPSKYRSEKFPFNSNRPIASKYETELPYRQPYYETERPIVEMTRPVPKPAPLQTSTISTHSGYYGGHSTAKNSYETATFKYPQQSTEKSANTKPLTESSTEIPHTTPYGISSTASSADIHSSFESNLIGPYFKDGSTKNPYRNLESDEQPGENSQITNENQAETDTGEFVEPIHVYTVEPTTSDLQNATPDRPPEISGVSQNIIIDIGAAVPNGSKVIDKTIVIPTSEASPEEHFAPDGRRFEGLLGKLIDMTSRDTTENPLLLVQTEAPDPEAIDAIQIEESVLDNNQSTIESTTMLEMVTSGDAKEEFTTIKPLETTTVASLKVVQRAEDQQPSSENNREVSTAPYEDLTIDIFPTSAEVPNIEITNIQPEIIMHNLTEQPTKSSKQNEATTVHYVTSIFTDSPVTQPYEKHPETTTQEPMTFLDLQTADQLQTDNPSVSAQEYTESIEYNGSATAPTVTDDSGSSFSEASINFKPIITTTTPYDWDIDPKTENGRGFKGDGLNFLIEKVVPPPRRSDILIEEDDYTEYEDNNISVGK